MERVGWDALTPYCKGVGQITPIANNGVRLSLAGATQSAYSDSQLDDFHGRPRRDFRWQPPVTLAVRARFSHPVALLRGTAGFGWWNNPFTADRAMLTSASPRSLWFFFAGAPANLALTGKWAGQGWFAQSLNVPSLAHFAGALGALWLRFPRLKARMERTATRLTRAAEQPLPHMDMTAWHEYQIAWGSDHAVFSIDGAPILTALHPPTAPLALVLWMDNQWADIRGRSGIVAVPHDQWMDLEDFRLWHGFSP
jgi:hypothetical protein